ncbi:MAG: hypothetical protein JO108_18075 [Acidobacteriaceae bacterium]|nr:hypothetical protein [Acidobacteriaceae bacterium]
MKQSLSFLLFGMALAVRCSSQALPTADEIVARMMEHDSQRKTVLYRYSGLRRYVLENHRYKKHAEMLVRMDALEDGSKEFDTLSASGWAGARRHVFPRLLEGEKRASLPENREQSRITPDNYSFELLGREIFSERAAYVLAITPKQTTSILFEAKSGSMRTNT